LSNEGITPEDISTRIGNKIIIGQKSIDRYLLVAMTLLKNKTIKHLIINARGSQNIAKSIIVAGHLKRNEDMKIKTVNIIDNTWTDKEDRERIGVEVTIVLTRE